MSSPIVIDIDGNPLDQKQTVLHLVNELLRRASSTQVLSSTVVVRFSDGEELSLRATLLPKRKRPTR